MGKQKSPGGVPSGLFCFPKLIKTLNDLIFISRWVININAGNGHIHIIYDWYKSTLKTTYYLNLDGKITKGPDLPMPLSDHAVLNINSTHAIVIGKSIF